MAVAARSPLSQRSIPGGLPQIVNDAFFPGNVFFVDSTSANKGTSAGYGLTPDAPLSTVAAALALCTANQGDTIFLMPGHAETIGNASISVAVAGVSIRGLGRGSKMPTFTHSHANSEISIAADNVEWAHIRHRSTITAVLVGIEIEDGADFAHVHHNKFDVAVDGTDEFNVTIRTNDASNNALIEYNEIDNGLGGAVAAISFTKDTDSTVVRGNRIWGDYSTACINGITTLSTKLLIEDNLLVNGIGGNINTEPGIELITGSTGIIRRNDIVCNLTTKAASIVADTALLFENYYNEDITGTGGLIGTASADD